MAELFAVESNTITYHLKEIYKTGELEELATARKIRVVQKEGKRDISREVEFYNLDAIIAVGYRVNSIQATLFRIWATSACRQPKKENGGSCFGAVINNRSLPGKYTRNGAIIISSIFKILLLNLAYATNSKRRSNRTSLHHLYWLLPRA